MPNEDEDGGGVTVNMAAQACVSAFVAVKPLDIFKKTSRKFPTVCGQQGPDVSAGKSGHLQLIRSKRYRVFLP